MKETIYEQKDYVEIILNGEISNNARLSFLERIKEIWEEYGKKPLLVNTASLEMEISVLKDMMLAENMPKITFFELGKIAVVDRKPRKESNDFFEIAALNRGIQIRFFYSNEDAIKWIRI